MKKPGEYANLLRSITKEWKWLLHYISHYRLHMVLYIVLGVVSIAMGLGSSVAAKHLIDAVVSHSSDTIFSAAAFAIAFALLQVVTSSVITRIASVVGTKVSNEIRESIYEHIVFSRWEDISKYHSGELLNRIEGDVTALAGSVVSFIPGVFTKLAQFAGCLIVVLYYDPVMAALAFLSSPFLLLTSKFSAKVMRKYNEQAREMNESGVVDIESHTNVHSDLFLADNKTVINELRLSKYLIKKHLNRDANYLAFPYGNYSDFVKQQAEKAGYKACVKIKPLAPGLNRKGDDVYELKRLTACGGMTGQDIIDLIQRCGDK